MFYAGPRGLVVTPRPGGEAKTISAKASHSISLEERSGVQIWRELMGLLSTAPQGSAGVVTSLTGDAKGITVEFELTDGRSAVTDLTPDHFPFSPGALAFLVEFTSLLKDLTGCETISSVELDPSTITEAELNYGWGV